MRKTIQEIFFERYQYLAEEYSRKISPTDSALEREDLVQDLSIKLFNAIKAYGRAWKRYTNTGRDKPMPIKAYLKSALRNLNTDKISQMRKVAKLQSLSIEQDGVDHGQQLHTPFKFEIDIPSKKVFVDGVDLLQGLDDKSRPLFCMFIQGFPKKQIKEVAYGSFPRKVDAERYVDNIIDTQTKRIAESMDLLELTSTGNMSVQIESARSFQTRSMFAAN